MTELTVKHMRGDGEVDYWAANHVRVACVDATECVPQSRIIHLYGVNGEDLSGSLAGGLVYLINSAGKTVDRIDLSELPPQLSE